MAPMNVRPPVRTYQFRRIIGCLPREEVVLDLWLFGVAGDEGCWLAKALHQGHGVLHFTTGM